MDARKRQLYDLRLVHLLDVEVRQPAALQHCVCTGREKHAQIHVRMSLGVVYLRPCHTHPHTRPLSTVHVAPCCFALQDYLERFKELILTASGLDMQPARAQPFSLGPERRQLLLTAA